MRLYRVARVPGVKATRLRQSEEKMAKSSSSVEPRVGAVLNDLETTPSTVPSAHPMFPLRGHPHPVPRSIEAPHAACKHEFLTELPTSQLAEMSRLVLTTQYNGTNK